MSSAPRPATGRIGGAVAAADQRAADVGARILAAGGNAADAAIATNAVMTVVAPHLCGMGGDLFALVHEPGRPAPTCVFAAGRAGSGADAATMRAEGLTAMPLTGDLRSVTVPGAVDGWLLLHREHGSLPLADLLEPAASIADSGFAASPLMAPSAPRIATLPGGGDFAGVTEAGHTMRRPGAARALRAIAREGREGFYGGEFGDGLLALGRELPTPLFTDDDLARPLAELVDPLRVRVSGHDVWSTPAPTQGYLLLLGLAVVESVCGGLAHLPAPGDPAWPHLLAEAARIAAYDRVDRLHDTADLAALLADVDELARRAGMVGPAARLELPGAARDGDTTYLCTVDGAGAGVSLIQSNALGYGSLLFEPSTGINLHNRGIGFSLVEGHPAELRPGARPPHTLTPALVTRADGSLRAVTGTMGGDAQPQIMLQLISRMLGADEPAADAMAAPRFRFGVEGSGFDTWIDPHAVRLELETGHPEAWRAGLAALGHPTHETDFGGAFGHAATIEIDAQGVRHPAADPRAVVGGVATT